MNDKMDGMIFQIFFLSPALAANRFSGQDDIAQRNGGASREEVQGAALEICYVKLRK